VYYWQQLDRLLTDELVKPTKPAAAELHTWIRRSRAKKAGSTTLGAGFRVASFSEQAVGVFLPVLFAVLKHHIFS
jgi:hypothetical protein